MDWQARFALGVPAMDGQHQALIETMNRVYERAAAGARPAEVLALLDDLVARARRHFADEEAYMASIDHPGLDRHRVRHERLLARLERQRADVAATGVADAELFGFLKLWLSSHICGTDTQYAAIETVSARPDWR